MKNTHLGEHLKLDGNENKDPLLPLLSLQHTLGKSGLPHIYLELPLSDKRVCRQPKTSQIYLNIYLEHPLSDNNLCRWPKTSQIYLIIYR